jgi:DNA modification methylase
MRSPLLDQTNNFPTKSNKYLNQIIHGDCIEILKNIPDKSIDLVILDPPYWKVIQQKWDYQWRTEDDYVKWCCQWLSEIARVIKLSGSLYLFGYLRNLFYLYEPIIKLGFNFRQQIVINKGIKAIGGRATKNYKMFPNVTESLLFFIVDNRFFVKNLLKERQKKLGLTSLEINEKLGVKINGGGMWSLYTGENILAQIPTKEMWEKLEKILDFKYPYEDIAHVFNIEMGVTDVWSDIDFYAEKRHHPTQKPVQLIERIINASSKEKMIVLDPFMGSGSTALACLNLNRYYVGIEKDEKYVKIAQQRIDEHQLNSDNNGFNNQLLLNLL